MFAYSVQTKTTNCIANQALQDSACTPGAVTDHGHKSYMRLRLYQNGSQCYDSHEEKVFKEYGIPWSLHSNYEVDHLISLEVGGSNDISNLWPESYAIKNSSLIKDSFENHLHKEVCSGKLSLPDAQRKSLVIGLCITSSGNIQALSLQRGPRNSS